MERRYKRAGIVAGLIGVCVILFAISISSSDTSLPKTGQANVEKVTPAPGGLQRPQAEVSVDLKDGLVGRLLIDGQVIPEDQLEKVVSLGQYIYRPGPNQIIESFEAGEHSAEIFYWESGKPEPPDPQSYVWTFRATS